jgi:hypothetical protein
MNNIIQLNQYIKNIRKRDFCIQQYNDVLINNKKPILLTRDDIYSLDPEFTTELEINRHYIKFTSCQDKEEDEIIIKMEDVLTIDEEWDDDSTN